jgi:glycerophosphoryl diester phosphodiesterase
MRRVERALLCLALLNMPFSASGKAPLIVAHRGASHDAPENTLASFRLAIEQKADVLETDMHLTKDGRIVLLHDADTKRVAGAPGHKVAETSSEVLRALDVGRGKDAKFAGARIPFLEELLELVPPDRGLFPEIKCKQEILPALEAALRKSGKLRQITLIGFDLEVMAAAKARLPEVPVCWLRGTEKDPKTKKPLPHRLEWIASAKERKMDGVDVNFEGLTPEFAKAVKAAGLALHVWTVDDPAEARRVAGLGVDSITTNRPDVIRKALAD